MSSYNNDNVIAEALKHLPKPETTSSSFIVVAFPEIEHLPLNYDFNKPPVTTTRRHEWFVEFSKWRRFHEDGTSQLVWVISKMIRT